MFLSTFKLKLILVKSSVVHVYIPEFRGESSSEVGVLKMSKMAAQNGHFGQKSIKKSIFLLVSGSKGVC